MLCNIGIGLKFVNLDQIIFQLSIFNGRQVVIYFVPEWELIVFYLSWQIYVFLIHLQDNTGKIVINWQQFEKLLFLTVCFFMFQEKTLQSNAFAFSGKMFLSKIYAKKKASEIRFKIMYLSDFRNSSYETLCLPWKSKSCG